MNSINSSSEGYSKAWKKWIEISNIKSIDTQDDFDGVLEVGTRKRRSSPIGPGFSLIHRSVFEQAGKVVGDKAYDHEEDGTPYLKDPWDTACTALLEASMSFGVPSLIEKQMIENMRKPLKKVAPNLIKEIEIKLKNLV